MKRIDILTLERDCLLYYSRMFYEAFLRKGIECRFFNLSEGKTREHLQTLFASPPDCLFGVSCIDAEPLFLEFGYDHGFVEECPSLLCDLLQIPYISFHLDPPLQFAHHKKSRFTRVAHMDRLACEMLRSFDVNTFFLPYAADSRQEMGQEERCYEVAFVGNAYDYKGIEGYWKCCYNASRAQLMRSVAEMTLHHPDLPLMEAFSYHLGKTKEVIPPHEFPRVYYLVEAYLRGKDRVELIRQLKDVEIHIFGNFVPLRNISSKSGWKEYFAGCPHVILHDTIPYEETLLVMQKSKILLNSSPQFRGGMHDRVMNGLSCGALVVTNDNPYLRETFTEEEGVCLFRYGQWEEMVDKIHTLLADEGKRQQYVDKGREKIAAAHTWDHRVETLLSIAF